MSTTDGATQPSDRLSLLRESIAALISVVILTVSVYMLIVVFHGAGKILSDSEAKPITEAIGRQKDILLIALGFLGTVTGYYLGRVPAERAADTARSAQSKAEENEAKTKRTVREGITKIINDPLVGGASQNSITNGLNNILQDIS